MKLMGQNWFIMKYSSSQEIKFKPSGEGNQVVGHSQNNYLKVTFLEVVKGVLESLNSVSVLLSRHSLVNKEETHVIY